MVKVSDFMSLLCNFLKSVLNIFVRLHGLLRVNKLSKTIVQFFNSEAFVPRLTWLKSFLTFVGFYENIHLNKAFFC